MSGFVKGISYLVTGKSGNEASEAAAQQDAEEQEQMSNIAQQRSAAATQAAGDTANGALAGIGRAPRGQRLLISSSNNGLASTLGTSS